MCPFKLYLLYKVFVLCRIAANTNVLSTGRHRIIGALLTKLKRNSMRFLLPTMTALVMFSLVACDSKDEDTGNDTAAEVEESTDTGAQDEGESSDADAE